MYSGYVGCESAKERAAEDGTALKASGRHTTGPLKLRHIAQPEYVRTNVGQHSTAGNRCVVLPGTYLVQLEHASPTKVGERGFPIRDPVIVITRAVVVTHVSIVYSTNMLTSFLGRGVTEPLIVRQAALHAHNNPRSNSSTIAVFSVSNGGQAALGDIRDVR